MIKEDVLRLLRREKGWLSGQAVCQALGVSRTAVWKAVERLRDAGYVIDSAPNKGYRLVRAPSRIRAEEILDHLPADHPWRDLLLCRDSVDSTNNRLKALAAQGAPQGTVMVAEEQTGGRGRMGRQFFSPPGMSVYLSAILRPDCAPQALMHLTCAIAEVMCDAIEEAAGYRPGIKWANDLIAGGRKLTGILTEMSIEAESGRVQYAVVGIGVNCCQQEADFPPELQGMAGSIAMASGDAPDRNLLAARMIQALERLSRTLLTEKKALMTAYRADCVTLGKQIAVFRGDAVRHGTALDVDEDGALLVQFPDGSREAVASGEVTVRGLYGFV